LGRQSSKGNAPLHKDNLRSFSRSGNSSRSPRRAAADHAYIDIKENGKIRLAIIQRTLLMCDKEVIEV